MLGDAFLSGGIQSFTWHVVPCVHAIRDISVASALSVVLLFVTNKHTDHTATATIGYILRYTLRRDLKVITV